MYARGSSSMAIIPNLLLKWANGVAGYSSKLAEKLRIAAINAAGSKAKLKIVFREDNIDIYFDEITDSETSVWQHYYSNAGVFFHGRPEEIHIDPESLRNEKFRVVKTADVEPMLKTNIIQKMFGFGQRSEREKQIQTATLVGVGIVLLVLLMQL